MATPGYVVAEIGEKIQHAREMRDKMVATADAARAGSERKREEAALDRAAMWGTKMEAYQECLRIVERSRR